MSDINDEEEKDISLEIDEPDNPDDKTEDKTSGEPIEEVNKQTAEQLAAEMLPPVTQEEPEVEDDVVNKARAKINYPQEPIIPPISVAVLEMAKTYCDVCDPKKQRICPHYGKDDIYCERSMTLAQNLFDKMQSEGLIEEQGNVFDPSPLKNNTNAKNSKQGLLDKISSGITGVMLAIILAVGVGYLLGSIQYVSKTDFTKNVGDMAHAIELMQDKVDEAEDERDSLDVKVKAAETTIGVMQQQINNLNSQIQQLTK